MVKSGMHHKGGANAGPAEHKMVTFSIRCWDTQVEFIQQAVLSSEVPQPEFVLGAALERAATVLNMPLPRWPEIKRTPVKTKTAVQVAAKTMGKSVKDFERWSSEAMAAQVLKQVPATGLELRKVGGTLRRG